MASVLAADLVFALLALLVVAGYGLDLALNRWAYRRGYPSFTADGRRLDRANADFETWDAGRAFHPSASAKDAAPRVQEDA